MAKYYKSADSKSSKNTWSKKPARQVNSFHFLSTFLYLFIFLFIFILVACGTVTLGSSSTSGLSSDLDNWTLLRAANHFIERRGHSSVVLTNSNGDNEIYVIGGDNKSIVMDDVWKSGNGGETWTQVITTGTKFSPRSAHSSVVLDGEIYVIGGAEANVYLDDVWKSGDGGLTWMQIPATGTKFSPRASHSSVVRRNKNGIDEIYVIGGFNGTHGLAEVWKSGDGGLTWMQIPATGTKFSPRFRHSSVVLKNNNKVDEIYVIGGWDGTKNLDEVWKSTDGTAWAQVATTKFSARNHHSSVVIGSEIYVIGGNGNNTVWKSSNGGVVWNKVTKDNTEVAKKFPVRSGHSSVVIGSDIYVIGGSISNDVYNADVLKSSDGEEWTVVKLDKTLFPTRFGHSAVVRDDVIYVIGGYTSHNQTYFDDVWKSDDGVMWTQVVTTGEKFSGRNDHSSVVLGSAIYVIGGWDGTKYLDEVWKSGNGGSTWTQVAKTKFSGREAHSSVVLSSEIYVIGGWDGTKNLDEVWKSGDGGLTWIQIPDTGTKFSPRARHSSVVLGSEIYVIGGWDGTKYLDEVWKSVNGGLTWTRLITTRAKFSGRNDHSSVVIANTIYVIGGNAINGVTKNDVWKSKDGVNWTELTSNAQFSARYRHSTVVFRGRALVIGGINNGGLYFNDVWASQ